MLQGGFNGHVFIPLVFLLSLRDITFLTILAYVFSQPSFLLIMKMTFFCLTLLILTLVSLLPYCRGAIDVCEKPILNVPTFAE